MRPLDVNRERCQSLWWKALIELRNWVSQSNVHYQLHLCSILLAIITKQLVPWILTTPMTISGHSGLTLSQTVSQISTWQLARSSLGPLFFFVEIILRLQIRSKNPGKHLGTSRLSRKQVFILFSMTWSFLSSSQVAVHHFEICSFGLYITEHTLTSNSQENMIIGIYRRSLYPTLRHCFLATRLILPSK